MLCQYPIPTQIGMVPCRQCQNCRINLQRIWACRIQLEALWHPYSSFVTLTYDPEYLPTTPYALPTLLPQDLTRFLKRFRNSNGSLRYFACGEYGTETERPHYHLVIFGISPMWETQISTAWSDPETKQTMGFISIYDLNEARAAYIAQYTVKKMTSTTSKGLNGRWPEFARMSTNKGVGNPAITWLADQHRTRLGSRELSTQGDVFTSIRINGKIWPLGQYMRKKLREELGVPATARDRAVMFGQIYKPKPDDWACPLEDYCPHSDITDTLTPARITRDEKEKTQALPEIRQKAAHQARRSHRRNTQTVNV